MYRYRIYSAPNRIEPQIACSGFQRAKITSAIASQPRSPKPLFVHVPPEYSMTKYSPPSPQIAPPMTGREVFVRRYVDARRVRRRRHFAHRAQVQSAARAVDVPCEVTSTARSRSRSGSRRKTARRPSPAMSFKSGIFSRNALAVVATEICPTPPASFESDPPKKLPNAHAERRQRKARDVLIRAQARSSGRCKSVRPARRAENGMQRIESMNPTTGSGFAAAFSYRNAARPAPRCRPCTSCPARPRFRLPDFSVRISPVCAEENADALSDGLLDKDDNRVHVVDSSFLPWLRSLTL